MQKLLLIDGNAIMHRAFHAIPPFKTKKGFPTNVLYGFFSMLYKSIVDFSPDYLVISFDTPAPTFRNKLYAEYQAQRPAMDNEFKIQIPVVKEALDKAQVTHIEKDGYESDDVIGTLANSVAKKGILVFILTGDKDIMQLVNDSIFVIAPQLGLSQVILYNKDEVVKRLGIEPVKIPDYKALAGDSADNYKGAKGIGPKTAIHLIEKFQSIENLFDNLSQIDNEKVRSILKENKEHVLLSKKLARIDTSVPVKISIEQAQFKGFNDELKEFLLQYEMGGLVKRMYQHSQKKVLQHESKTAQKQSPDQVNLFDL